MTVIALEILRVSLLGGGLFFFATGALGLLRFPDTYTRLHAVTKADNVGLGMLAAGLAMTAADWHSTAMLMLVWLLVMASGATSCQLLARYHREQGVEKESGHVDG